ncbi:kinase-like domain-containing protein [Macrophomina phaseolina]|uniref:Kinase-like domain-containing protein n=1 Tax=Macrophomina phaseolina TaxID=35725 RepID=A0ABQ8G0R0_9PEZI|nr:kinase-like domain-containing protein [Macrophomina phaseolina]
MAITTTPQLEDYLRSTGIEFTSVEPLSGGTANYVWRLTLPSGETRVLKHAEPYIKNHPDFPFDVDRIQFEGNALSLLPQTLSTTQLAPAAPTVRIPTLHHTDPTAHIVVMDDAGPSNLKSWYSTTTTSSSSTATPALIPSIGAALGTWLAQLHHRTRNLRRPFNDNTTAKNIYRHAYAHLAEAFALYGLDTALASDVDASYGPLLLTDDECVCHGDFWPGNVLVEEGTEDGSMTLSIVDWEMTRRGTGATDVAQFAAEAYLLDRFRGGKGLVRAFLEAYVAAAREQGGVLGERFLERLVVHFGVHVAFWPTRVEWCGKEETGELVKFGREYIMRGRGRDWEFVRAGPLEPVLGLLE